MGTEQTTPDGMAECVRERITRSALHPYVDGVYVTHETKSRECTPIVIVELDSGQKFKLTVEEMMAGPTAPHLVSK